MWSTYNYDIANYPFIQIGFVMGALVPFLLIFTYPIVKRRTKQWARRYLGIVAYGYMALGIVDFVWGAATSQLSAFLDAFGWAVLLEFFVLATLFFLVMLIMANKAVSGLGSKGKRVQQAQPDTHQPAADTQPDTHQPAADTRQDSHLPTSDTQPDSESDTKHE